MNSVTLAWGVLTTLVLLGLWGGTDGLAIERQVENALLSPDWPVVFTRLQTDTTQVRDPVARLVLGHASLATNRNNTAMMLFLSVQAPGDFQQWAAWTAQLLHAHPKSPVALYLAADAAARTGRFAEAIAGFTQAVERQPTFGLAYNARGVIYVLTKAWDLAWADFARATTLAADLADAYANLGTLSVLQEVALQQGDAAVEAFNHALTLNSQFALAYNGRGCLYFGSGQFEQAAADFRQAFQLTPTLAVAAFNEGIAAAYAGELHTLVRLMQPPGMALESRLEQQETALRTQASATTTPIPSNVLAALPHMARDRQQAVIAQYGLDNVRDAVQHQIEANHLEALKLNRASQGLMGQIGALEKLQVWNAITRDVVSIAATGSEIAGALRQGWKPYVMGEGVRRDAVEIAKSSAAARTKDWNTQVVLNALTGDPWTSTLNSVSHVLEASLNDASAGAQSRQAALLQRTAGLALQNRNFSGFLQQYHLGGKSRTDAPGRSPSTAQPVTRRPDPREGRTAQLSSSAVHSSPLPSDTLRTPERSQVHQPPNPRPPVHPGGVSTAELASTFVDKGHWPVMTLFGLFYPSTAH